MGIKILLLSFKILEVVSIIFILLVIDSLQYFIFDF